MELSVHTEPHDPQRVHLRVQDDGAGIAASERGRAQTVISNSGVVGLITTAGKL